MRQEVQHFLFHFYCHRVFYTPCARLAVCCIYTYMYINFDILYIYIHLLNKICYIIYYIIHYILIYLYIIICYILYIIIKMIKMTRLLIYWLVLKSGRGPLIRLMHIFHKLLNIYIQFISVGSAVSTGKTLEIIFMFSLYKLYVILQTSAL